MPGIIKSFYKLFLGGAVTLALACLAWACDKELSTPESEALPKIIIQCVLTDTKSVQHLRLCYFYPDTKVLMAVPPEELWEISIRGDEFFCKFNYEGKGIWKGNMIPRDGFQYNLYVCFNGNKGDIYSGVTYPKRPEFKGDVREFERAYFPATNDTVNNVVWMPKYPESGRPVSFIGEIPNPSKVWFFLGQPKGGGGLRYSEVVATKKDNRAMTFNIIHDNVFSLPCWSDALVKEIGWSIDRDYDRTSYSQGINVTTPAGAGIPGLEILSYDLIGDYDVDYASKHLPVYAEGDDKWAAYSDPLLIGEVRIVDDSFNGWIEKIVKNREADPFDVLDNVVGFIGKKYSHFSTQVINQDRVYGLFGAESVIRYPIGLGDRDYAPPVAIK